jgi:hypothetical protein
LQRIGILLIDEIQNCFLIVCPSGQAGSESCLVL